MRLILHRYSFCARWVAALASIFIGTLRIVAQEAVVAPREVPKWENVDLGRSVRASFMEKCAACHGNAKQEGGLDVRSVVGLLRGGDGGPVVLPGNPEGSRLWQVIQSGSDPHMPPDLRQQLSEDAIQQIATWIDHLPSDLSLEQAAVLDSQTQPSAQSATEFTTPPANPRLETPLHRALVGAEPTTVINLFVEMEWERHQLTPAPVVDDRAFVRRIYLDLVGRIPFPDETKSFLTNPSSQKRIDLVDELLSRTEHANYMAELMDAMLLGRGNEKQRDERERHGWYQYLRSSCEDNKPWDQMARDMLLARVDQDLPRGKLWYLYERDNKHQEIAEAIATHFFGVDVACAQCHNHPLASEIEQRHYWGLVAFFKRSQNSKSERGIALGESAIGAFDQFANLAGSSQFAELVFLDRESVFEARPDSEKQEDLDELYISPPGEPRIPKFSRREAFVDQILANHPRFSRAWVNRMWGLLLGRGIVQPVDKMDSQHAPSHVDLLDWLATDFSTHGYDIRRLIRSIVLSRPYQLQALSPIDQSSDPSIWFSAGLEKRLTAESIGRSIEIALFGCLREDKRDLRNRLDASLRQEFPDVLPGQHLTNLKQALLLSNHPSLNQLTLDAAAEWRAIEVSTSVRETIDRIYEQMFMRFPSDEERTAIMAFREAFDDSEQAWNHILWALVTSAEFQWNH